MNKYFLIIFVLLNCNKIFSQSSYSLLFNSSEFDEVIRFVYDDKPNNEQIVLLNYECEGFDSVCITRQKIYSISNYGDTMQWPFADRRNDTTFLVNRIIRDINGDYFMTGLGYSENNGPLRKVFDYYTKWNSNHEIIWEKFHIRPPDFNPFMASENIKILELINGNYLVGMTVTTVDSIMDIRYYFVEVSPLDGIVIKEKVLDFGGYSYLQSLTYNLDSTKIMLHSGSAYMKECNRNTEGTIFLDPVTYDTLGTYCYNRDDDDPLKYWCVVLPYNAKICRDGTLIVAGTGRCINTTNKFVEHYLFAYKYDASFNLLNRKFLTNQDTIIDASWLEGLDINDNNEILLVGNHDRQIGPWSSHYSYIYLAKLDQNLALVSERYLGGDAYYTAYSMSATSDGGILVAGTRFDYMVNDFERDAFVMKTDAGLWVDTPGLLEEDIHRALVYPNPGKSELSIRTTVKQAVFRLFDISNRLLLEQPVDELITTVNTRSFQAGTYTWTITKAGQVCDRGIWIKN